MTLLSDWGMARMMTEPVLEVNRAFSANDLFLPEPGALPQAGSEYRAVGAKANAHSASVAGDCVPAVVDRRYSFVRAKIALIFARDANVTASEMIIARTSLRGTLIVLRKALTPA
jgi:hypothetical protein